MTGFVTRVWQDKGFGFVRADEDPTEYFFHQSALTGAAFTDVRPGTRVEFEREADAPKGPRAATVRALGLGAMRVR